jgi:tRNA-uridine 2-sulfurtransferase
MTASRYSLPGHLSGRRVLLAISGGVDSSVAALLLRDAGAEVIGATFRNFCFSEHDELPERSCCSLEAVDDARRVCEALGLQHELVDETDRFEREVIDDFHAEYARGRTPNPCVRCNTAVRYPRLLEEADRLGCDAIATGHYARIVHDENAFFLARGRDEAKDQSYFLAGMDPSSYPRVLFPLGDFEKPAVRQMAREADLHIADKGESQDVCFMTGRTLVDYLSEFGALRRGEIIGPDGVFVGEHRGIELFTVGQRQGLGVALGRPVYVSRVDAQSGRVYLGDASDLLARHVVADAAWLAPGCEHAELVGKIRYRSEARPVESLKFADGRLDLRFAESVSAAAPGQSLVLYTGDRVMGHGIIEEAGP